MPLRRNQRWAPPGTVRRVREQLGLPQAPVSTPLPAPTEFDDQPELPMTSVPKARRSPTETRPSRAAPQLERDIQRAIFKALDREADVYVWRQNTGATTNAQGAVMRFGVLGGADIIGVVAPYGRMLALEVKSATGRQTDAQKKFADRVAQRGGVYRVVRSVEEALAALANARLLPTGRGPS